MAVDPATLTASEMVKIILIHVAGCFRIISNSITSSPPAGGAVSHEIPRSLKCAIIVNGVFFYDYMILVNLWLLQVGWIMLLCRYAGAIGLHDL